MTIMEVGSEADSGQSVVPVSAREPEAAQLATRLLSPEAIDALLAEAYQRGLAVDGPGGLIQQMIGAVPGASVGDGDTRVVRPAASRWPIISATSVAGPRLVGAVTIATARPGRCRPRPGLPPMPEA